MKVSIRKAYIFWISVYLIALPTGAINIGSFGSVLKMLSIIPVGLGVLSIKYFEFEAQINKYMLYLMVSFISCFYSTSFSTSWSKTQTFFMLFLLMASCGCFYYYDDEVIKLKKCLVWSSRLSVVLVLFFGTYNGGRLWLQNGILDEDPNYFCMYLAFGFIYCTQVLIEKNPFRKKIISSVEMLVYIVICLLTGSRGGLLALMAGAVLYLIFNGDREFNLKKVSITFFVTVVVYIALNCVSDFLQGRYTINDVISTGGSSRMLIWQQGIKLFKQSTWFRRLVGYGIATTPYDFTIYGYRIKNVMHNMFLESLLEIGIIGCGIYISMIISFVKASLVNSDRFAFGVLLCMIIMSLSTSISSFKPYINIMMFIIILSRLVVPENEMKR